MSARQWYVTRLIRLLRIKMAMTSSLPAGDEWRRALTSQGDALCQLVIGEQADRVARRLRG